MNDSCPSRREHPSCRLISAALLQWGRERVTWLATGAEWEAGGRRPGEPWGGGRHHSACDPGPRGLLAPAASGCCRSVKPKETAARASTAQDGGSRVSVSVCGQGRGPGHAGVPSWSCPAGGGRQGLGPLQAAGTGQRGTAPKGPIQGSSPTRPQRFPSPPSQPRRTRRLQGALASLRLPGEGLPASPLPGACTLLVGSQKEGAQRSLGRRLGTTILGLNKPYVSVLHAGWSRGGRPKHHRPRGTQVVPAPIWRRGRRGVGDLGLRLLSFGPHPTQPGSLR